MFSKKATKIDEIFTVDLTVTYSSYYNYIQGVLALCEFHYTQSPIIRTGPIRLGAEFWGKFKT